MEVNFGMGLGNNPKNIEQVWHRKIKIKCPTVAIKYIQNRKFLCAGKFCENFLS